MPLSFLTLKWTMFDNYQKCPKRHFKKKAMQVMKKNVRKHLYVLYCYNCA